MPSVSDYIKLSAEESVIKEYRNFEMKKPQKAALHIAITSRRLILYGITKAASKMNRPSLTQEMNIEDIRGLEIYEKKPQNPFVALFGAIVFLAGMYGLYSPATSFFFTINAALNSQVYGGIITAAVGILIFLLSFVAGSKEMKIIIKGKNENLNSGIFGENTSVKWGADSNKILCELGSVILNVQDNYEGCIPESDDVDYSEIEDFPNEDEYYKDDAEQKSGVENYSESLDLLEGGGEEGEKRDDYLF